MATSRIPTSLKKRAHAVAARLAEAYPQSGCALRHGSAHELLVATILSAQCTDARVNQVMPGLLQRWPDAAAMAGITPAAFGRFFRREVGKSFIDFVNDARCSWAALRLLEGTEPIAEIALSCGFASLSNFGEQFRRRYRVSPREYRRQALETSR